MTKTIISIIIVSFNSEKYIDNCIHSALKALQSIEKSKIIVVDNNSSDTTIKKVGSLMSKYGNIELINNRQNLGFARAINLGIKKARSSEYFLLLNPDTISNKSSITNLLCCARNNHAGVVGGSTSNDNGIANGSHFRTPTLNVGIYDFTNIRKLDRGDKWHKYFYYIDNNFSNIQSFPVDIVTGGYMLITSEVISKIGYFDESFFMYLEDVDFCVRAKAAGVNIFHCNNSKIIHFSGRSSNNKDGVRHSSWLISRKKYFQKHFGLFDNMIIQPIFLIDDLFILMKLFFKK